MILSRAMYSTNSSHIYPLTCASPGRSNDDNGRRWRTDSFQALGSSTFLILNLVILQLTRTQSIIWVVTALAITLVVSRLAIRLFIVKKTTIDNVLASDVLMLLALATLIAMAGLYVQIIPTMFDLDLAAAGKPPMSPESTLEFEERANRYLRIQFGIIILFWTCVWAVKLSILVFYKSLFDRLSRTYLYAWWAVVSFVALTYVGCWALQFESCSPLMSYFKIGSVSTFAFHFFQS